jgi:hypothetical protein
MPEKAARQKDQTKITRRLMFSRTKKPPQGEWDAAGTARLRPDTQAGARRRVKGPNAPEQPPTWRTNLLGRGGSQWPWPPL